MVVKSCIQRQARRLLFSNGPIAAAHILDFVQVLAGLAVASNKGSQRLGFPVVLISSYARVFWRLLSS
jgi:hypothetical protein